MDEADYADEQSAIYLADALNRVRTARKEIVTTGTGECAYCGSLLPSKVLVYCDTECALALRHERTIRRKQGFE